MNYQMKFYSRKTDFKKPSPSEKKILLAVVANEIVPFNPSDSADKLLEDKIKLTDNPVTETDSEERIFLNQFNF
jgi:hypothetical protein